ncbi:hypothetical protein [Treponema sp. OMZ 788]|uniref:hypothetical protein n=2 Tax=unclassified Treponema TaxID=2638727 RepID=UPI0020A59F1B|nr:hypothetical protein [Treponema sp. OMZ 788]
MVKIKYLDSINKTYYNLSMNNIYKTKLHRILLNCLYGLAAAFFIALITEFVLKNTLLAAVVFLAVLAAYAWLVIIGNIISIEVSDSTLTVKQGKTSTTFNRDEISLRAEIITQVPRSGGMAISTSCFLYITQNGGQEKKVDCELLGRYQFEKMLEDLNIGDSVTKIEKEQDKSN